MYVIVWEFRTRQGREREFEEAYGPEGVWARFFRGGDGHLRTELHRDLADTGRYLTLDRWTSRTAFEIFRERHREEYEAIDRRCEALTEHEALLGTFESIGGETGGPDGRRSDAP